LTVSVVAAVTLVTGSLWFTARLRDRLLRSLCEQARAERLAGNSRRSLGLIAEAARMNSNPEVRQEAVPTLTTPAVRLRHQFPVGTAERVAFSPDGTLLAAGGQFAVWPATENNQGLGVWRMPSGQPLSEVHSCWWFFAFNPSASQLAVAYPDGT